MATTVCRLLLGGYVCQLGVSLACESLRAIAVKAYIAAICHTWLLEHTCFSQLQPSDW